MTIPATPAPDQPAVEPWMLKAVEEIMTAEAAMQREWHLRPMEERGDLPGREEAADLFASMIAQHAPRPSPDAGEIAGRRVVAISSAGVDNNSSTQCNQILTVLCDDGTMWSKCDVGAFWSPLPEVPARVRALQPSARAEAEAEIAGIATRHYCNSLERFSRTECLGWEQKVKDGRFGAAEFEAHAEANREMGRHQGIHEALRILASRRREAGGE